MTEPKFTPAPWSCTESGFMSDNSDTRTYFIVEAKGMANRQKTNANLISAAPDLYHELEKCAKLLRSYEHHHLQKGDREKADRNRRRAEKCERVLAKARGENQ